MLSTGPRALSAPSIPRDDEREGVEEEVRTMMYWNSGGWIWMIFMSLLWIVLIGLIVWAVVRLTQQPSRHDDARGGGPAPRETPEEIADRRFASGEIDADTYTAIHERLARRRASQHR
jgi:putative membrane protein